MAGENSGGCHCCWSTASRRLAHRAGLDVIPYRKFSDTLQNNARTFTPPKPPKVPKTAEPALGGLGPLGRAPIESRNLLLASEQAAGPPSVPDFAPREWGAVEEERAAIVEYEAGAPRAWADALARLNPSKPPCDVPPKRWVQFIDDCGRFLDSGWAERAAMLGWGPLDLFGCDRERPFARIDHLALLWLLNGDKLVELHRDQGEDRYGDRITRRPIQRRTWQACH